MTEASPEPTEASSSARDAGPAIALLGQTIGDQAVQIAFLQADSATKDRIIESLQNALVEKKES